VYEVISSTEHFAGRVFTVVTDQVAMPDGDVVGRDYIRHVGAVAVVALDDDEQVVLVRQYRHPVRRHLWELPAGLIDVAGEGLADAALRELAEEADLAAGWVDLLVDLFTTPGCASEMIRVFLARDLTEIDFADRHDRRHEESDLIVQRFALDEAVGMVFDGYITNATAVAGVLAAARARDDGFASLRPADAPLPPE
jgi:8-oxo-dGDP phosphatase